MVQFAQFLFSEHKKPDTVQNYISSIRIIHRLAELPCPDSTNIHCRMLIDGLKRQCTRPVRQADAMGHQTLKLLFTAVDLTQELEAVAWTAVLVGFTLVL